MSGSIVDLSLAPGGVGALDGRTVDVAIVGSGCGGATAARELARAGREVVVLEEGRDYTGRQLNQRESQMYDQLYMERGGRATTDLSVAVLQGRVLGGGGVINACDVVPIPDGVLRCWQDRFGLADFSPGAIAPHRDAALADLSASRPEPHLLNEANLRLQRGTEALGWKGEVMMHNRVGCAGFGTCLVGCSLDAKRNPRFVAIPQALEAGATFHTRVRAVGIEGATSELKTLRLRGLDPLGYHETGEATLRARTVVVAANAIASAQLLLRSGIGNEHVGRNLSLQPQLPITALFPDEVRAFRGIPQAYAVTEFEDDEHPEHGWWGYRIEAVMGTPGIVSSMLPIVGVEGKELMSLFPRVAASLLLTPDVPSGTVRVEASGRLRVDYALSDELKQRYRAAARAAARIYLEAGAESVILPVAPPVEIRSAADLARIDDVAFRPAEVSLLSAHQQGTVRFAPSPSGGGADPTGQVYGTKGVYVFDSSGFPTSSSSHTMTPILTISRFLSQRLAAALPA